MKVMIIGAGNIGRRHVEGALHYKSAKITVVDNNKKSLQKQEELLSKIHYADQIRLLDKIPDENFDVVIVSTSSKPRKNIVKKIKDKAGYIILEKFLFPHIDDYDIDLTGHKIYVNCPRRYIDGYMGLESPEPEMAGKTTIYYHGMPGLLSNTIHFIDLLSYMTGIDEINIQDINIKKFYRSKRPGYWDIDGRVIVFTGDGVANAKGMIYLSSSRKNNNKKKSNLIINDHGIDEFGRTITDIKGKVKEFDFKMQSELTGLYLSDIAETGKCKLIDYDRCAQWHIKLLEKLGDIGWDKPIT